MAKLGAMSRLRKRRADKLESKRQSVITLAPPSPATEPSVDPIL